MTKQRNKYWIISDTHFGHDNITEFCGRPDDFEDRILMGLVNNVGPNDILIHLGDICFGRNANEWHEKLMSIKCYKKWLAIGNHDPKSNIWYLEHGWDYVSYRLSMSMYGKKILFSHKPMADDGYDINIHGHFHNIDHRRHEPELVAIKNDKQFLISMEETNYQPVHLRNIVEGKKWK
jgi:calcineurin-like phosphoesterase family protein